MEGLIGRDAGAGDSGCGLQLRFHRRWRRSRKWHHARILIVANVERIPLATYQKIAEYAAKGGHVIFTQRLPRWRRA